MVVELIRSGNKIRNEKIEKFAMKKTCKYM